MPTALELTIHREYPAANCTSGYLAINGTIACYTLEREWADNAQNVSSIPAGTYQGTLRYDHADHWRIELVGVPGRTNIQLHIGNEPDQSKGCILVGRKLTADLCSLEQSALAYDDLRRAFYGTATPMETPARQIAVQIVDAGS